MYFILTRINPCVGVFIPQVIDVGDALLQDGLLASELADLQLEDADVLEPLVVLNLALVQCRLLDLDLLVQQCQFVVSSDQLRSEYVAFAYHLLQFVNGPDNETSEQDMFCARNILGPIF